jgi:transcriptional regulator with XRE-family HTH domain
MEVSSMEASQGQKFSYETTLAKRNIKLLRLLAGKTLGEGASLLGISRKQMEDIEATRNYGCYLNLDTLINVSKKYDVPVESLLVENASWVEHIK